MVSEVAHDLMLHRFIDFRTNHAGSHMHMHVHVHICTSCSVTGLFSAFFWDFWPDVCLRFLAKFFDPGFWAENTVYSTTGTEKYRAQYYRDRETKTIYYLLLEIQ